jgi:DSF synthase
MRLAIPNSEQLVIDEGGAPAGSWGLFVGQATPAGITSQVAPAGIMRGPAGADLLLRLIGSLRLTELRVEHDAELGVVWCFFQHGRRPCFTLSLLKDIRSIQRLITDFHRDHPREARRLTRFVIWGSDLSSVFNLGGDLGYFVELLERSDIISLKAYAMTCLDVCFANYSGLHADVIVGALVAGDALGGGFECALSCDFVIAESPARFGLPEILYGLFPGMGAYSFLSRRIGQAKAESLILEGRLYNASEMHELGLAELVAAPGHGRQEMERHLLKLSKRFDAVLSVFHAKRRTAPISYREMTDIVEDWVSTGAQLSSRSLRKMRKLAIAQDARRDRSKSA